MLLALLQMLKLDLVRRAYRALQNGIGKNVHYVHPSWIWSRYRFNFWHSISSDQSIPYVKH